MSLSVGIVGLPNVGKSTLFNALMQRQIAKVGKHPFTTVSPNKGMVAVPDERLKKLVGLVKKELGGEVEIRPAVIEFVDIAGLVKGAAQGAGLGNQFLSHIRQVDLILHILREFDNPQAPHVSGIIDPVNDISTVELELVLADFETVVKALEQRQKKAKTDKKYLLECQILEKVKQTLEQGNPALTALLDDDELKIIQSFNLLTLKPSIFILNIAEKHLDEKSFPKDNLPKGIIIPVCVKLASDLYELDDKERKEFLSQFKIKKTGLEQVIKTAYQTLNLITFYTIKGGKIISAWSLKQDGVAIDAASTIHSDFAQRFVKAEVIDFASLEKIGSWQLAKEKGLLKTGGKDYLIKDGDIIEFKLN